MTQPRLAHPGGGPVPRLSLLLAPLDEPRTEEPTRRGHSEGRRGQTSRGAAPQAGALPPPPARAILVHKRRAR